MLDEDLIFFFKVHIFWEGHKILRNHHLTFDYSTYSQKFGEDFAKFCGLLRIYKLYIPIHDLVSGDSGLPIPYSKQDCNWFFDPALDEFEMMMNFGYPWSSEKPARKLEAGVLFHCGLNSKYPSNKFECNWYWKKVQKLFPIFDDSSLSWELLATLEWLKPMKYCVFTRSLKVYLTKS